MQKIKEIIKSIMAALNRTH